MKPSYKLYGLIVLVIIIGAGTFLVADNYLTLWGTDIDVGGGGSLPHISVWKPIGGEHFDKTFEIGWGYVNYLTLETQDYETWYYDPRVFTFVLLDHKIEYSFIDGALDDFESLFDLTVQEHAGGNYIAAETIVFKIDNKIQNTVLMNRGVEYTITTDGRVLGFKIEIEIPPVSITDCTLIIIVGDDVANSAGMEWAWGKRHYDVVFMSVGSEGSLLPFNAISGTIGVIFIVAYIFVKRRKNDEK